MSGCESRAWVCRVIVYFGHNTGRYAPSTTMKKPTQEERRRQCTGKRKYRSQGDALDAALVAGVERRRKAYRCPLCGQWHLTSS